MTLPARSTSGPRRSHRPGQSGFTLMEVLAVLAVISILAAVATPAFVEMIRERRTQREAAMFADTFRVARARALGRGAAVSVTITGGEVPRATIYEHVTADADQLPLAGCRAAGTWRLVSSINGRPSATKLTLHGPNGGDFDDLGVCYSPRGRTYWSSTGSTDDFGSLNGVIELDVERGDGASAGVKRSVFVMPNGQTRVSL